MTAFFKDIKVIELASVLAGPSAGMFFAELGAKVLKVENKAGGGDATRGWRLPGESAEGPSAYFCAINYGKEHIFLDLSLEADRSRLEQAVKDADIVLSNYRDNTAEKLGVSYQRLSQIKPDLIFVQLDGFESHDRPAYDVVLQAETGWISMNGTDAAHIAKMPVALIDVLAGHQMKEAALLALLKRERNGKGSYVRCSLEQSSLAALANQATNYLMNGHVAAPIGTLHPNIAPYGDMFRTCDARQVVLAVGTDGQFAKLCEVLVLSKLPGDARFQTNTGRVNNRAALQAKLAEAMATFELNVLESMLSAANIPYGVVRKLDEVLESPVAQSMVLESEMEGRHTRRLSSITFNPDFLDA